MSAPRPLVPFVLARLAACLLVCVAVQRFVELYRLTLGPGEIAPRIAVLVFTGVAVASLPFVWRGSLPATSVGFAALYASTVEPHFPFGGEPDADGMVPVVRLGMSYGAEDFVLAALVVFGIATIVGISRARSSGISRDITGN